MEFIDIGTIASAAFGGGGVWAAVRLEIKYLWRDIDRMHREITQLRGALASVTE